MLFTTSRGCCLDWKKIRLEMSGGGFLLCHGLYVCVCAGGGNDLRVEGGSNANAMTGCNRSVCVGVGGGGRWT